VNDSSTVGTVPSSSSRESRGSWYSSRGTSSNAHRARGSQVSIATIAIAKTIGVSPIGSSIAQTIGTSIAETSIAIGSVVGISLSLSLGNMNYSPRVGNIPSGTSIASSNSRDSSRGKTIDVDSSRVTHTSIASSIAKTIGVSSIGSSIAQTIGTSIAETSIAIGSVVGISLSLSLSLGNMNNTPRVGGIPSSSSIASSNSRESSRGKTIDIDCSRGAHASIASSIAKTIGEASVGSSIGIASIRSNARIAIGSIVRVSIS